MRVEPLRPLIPRTNAIANHLTCPPYDVLSQSEARTILSTNPSSFLQVTRPDAIHPPNTPLHALYAAANDALATLQTTHLTREQTPTLYIYAQTASTHTQYGLVCLVHAADYRSGTILRHERTRPDKEADRTYLTDILSANVGPVFLTYPDVPLIDQVVAQIVTADPLFHVMADDPPVIHRVWRVPPQYNQHLTTLFDHHVPVSYIADGHHRAASAATVATRRAHIAIEGSDPSTSVHPSACFLAVLFPASQLRILPYNRLVRDLNGHTPAQFLARLSTLGSVTPFEGVPPAVPDHPGAFHVFVDNRWYRMTLPRDAPHYTTTNGSIGGSATIADSLDCAMLQKHILRPLLGVNDPRQSERIQFVGGVRGIEFLEACVRRGEAAVAFALHPVSVKQLMHVADQGEIMPPKSTWFEPKLRSGFFVHTF